MGRKTFSVVTCAGTKKQWPVHIEHFNGFMVCVQSPTGVKVI